MNMLLATEEYASFEPAEALRGTFHATRPRHGRGGQRSRRSSFPAVLLFASKFSRGRPCNNNNNSGLVVVVPSDTVPSDEDEIAPSSSPVGSDNDSTGVEAAPPTSHVGAMKRSLSSSRPPTSASNQGQPRGGLRSPWPALSSPRLALAGSAELV